MRNATNLGYTINISEIKTTTSISWARITKNPPYLPQSQKMHEILTLQLGQRANYLSTHYWNTQESYHTFPPSPPSVVDHDVHFRQGIGADGTETYLPRTLIYDLKGGFGSLRKVNELYEIEGGCGEGVW